MNFDMVQKSSLAFVKVSELDQMGILYQTESFLTACVYRDNSRHVRTHEENLLRCVRRLGTIIQSIFCAQSGAGIRLNVWKWSVESRYPGALSPVMKTFRAAFSPDPTDCPWVSEDGANAYRRAYRSVFTEVYLHGKIDKVQVQTACK